MNQPVIEIEDSQKEKREKAWTADIKTNMIFRKDKSELEGYLLHLVFDEDAYKDKKEKKFFDKKFTGYAIVTTLEGERVELSYFKNGKQTHSTVTNKKGRPADQYVTICTTYYSIACWNNGQNCGSIQSSTFCEDVWFTDVNNSNLGSISLISYNGGGIGSVSSLYSFSSLDGFWNWFPSLNQTEKDYFLWHPHLVPGAIAAWTQAKLLVNLFYCSDADFWNGNAFKHMFWSAMLSRYVGHHNARIITDNHEAGEDLNTFPPQMDFANNDMGILTYDYILTTGALNTLQSESEKIGHIANVVLNKISSGNGMRIFSNQLVPTDGTGRCH